MRAEPQAAVDIAVREAPSFAHVLHRRAQTAPDALAFRFVAEDESAQTTTYGELDSRARAAAAAIAAATRHRHEPVLLLFAPGLDYVSGLFGCFYAGVPAVPAFPPDPARLSRTMPRLVAIVEDLDAEVVLTTSDIAPLVERWFGDALGGRSPRVVATDRAGDAGDERAPSASADALALIQYTSGSTALPRGVQLEHRHLLANAAEIRRAFAIGPEDSAALWLPPYHDMGLIGGILEPIFSGIEMTLTSPIAFLRRPLLWLLLMSRYGATMSGAPNFAYDLCVRRATDADLEQLDLSRWELAFSGAEPVRAETLEAFRERFAPCGFRGEALYPCYGLAEATLLMTGVDRLSGWRTLPVAREPLDARGEARPPAPGEPARTLVGCGAPGPRTRLAIVDPQTRERLPEGRVGEIWLASPSVAGGYWRRPAETAATFGATTSAGDGPYLRTGDLGFLADGELFVTGRLKDLIVLNGRNHHPVDVERACEAAVEGIRRNCGAAFAVDADDGAGDRLVVVYEAAPGGDDAAHRAAIDGIRRSVSMELSLPPHAVVLVRPRTIPKTSSGKVQRWLCRRRFLAGELEELARWEAPVARGRRGRAAVR